MKRIGWMGAVCLLAGYGLWPAMAAGPADSVPGDHAEKMAKGLKLFTQHVRPILEKRCLRCHGGRKIESEFDLSSRKELLRGGAAGPAIIPGRAKDSYLFKLINHVREPHMPHRGKKLSDKEIAYIGEWIDHYAPYDRPFSVQREEVHWTQKVVEESARDFWAFRPLAPVEPPAVKDKAWCRNPIDFFIRSRQEEAGIAPNAVASKRVLIRRAYFDLLGLPPPPAEVETFLKDPSPDPWPNLIDRLLASPHYGERWARHWLDLARFAESHGFEHDYDRPTAYHYRDFVIKALNQDLPYDTFVRWQIAGDELAPDNNLALQATGFLAAGVHSTQITKNEVEKHRYDELDDMLSTVGTAMLGLTLGCARCHDHKYDPIPQRDYYRMLATFTTTVRTEVELNLDPEGYRLAKKKFDQEHKPYIAARQQFEANQLPGRLRAWEKSASWKSIPWLVPEMLSAKSNGGATLALLDDGSYRVSGKNPKFDTYTIRFKTGQTTFRAIRLEALTDPSLVRGGPGRAKNGNFALTDLRITITSPGQKDQGRSVRLVNPRATFSQKSLPIDAAIDANPKSGWAVDPQIGKNHAAVFELANPIDLPAGAVVTVAMDFKNNVGHNLGRFRLSIAANTGGELRGDTIPEDVRRFVQIDETRRTTQQQQRLLNWYKTIDPEWRRLHDEELVHLKKAPQPKTIKALVSSEGLPPIRLHSQGQDFFEQTYFLRRGDPNLKEGVATQGFLQVLVDAPDSTNRWWVAPPPGWRTSYRRRAFAQWLTDVEHGAGKLLARVIVNRLWQHHLGRGIVATPSDFGTRGERPTHPELLEWLANELVRNGWRLKPIHKLIMTSATYMQDGGFDSTRARVDRENRLFWRRTTRRLEAEVIRDSLLAVCGELDRRMFGPGTLDQASRRRSIYFTVKRSKLVPMMVVFDAPEALTGVGQRPTTTIAPQALLLMNNPQVRHYAKAFASHIAQKRLEDHETVRQAFLTALSRPATAEETTDAIAFLKAQKKSYEQSGKKDSSFLALTDFCHALMCLNEFIYVE